MPNRRYNSRRFTPSCSNSITNSCRCDMIDFSDHGTPAPPQQAKDADRMCPPCLRTPVHYLSGLYKGGEGDIPAACLAVRSVHALAAGGGGEGRASGYGGRVEVWRSGCRLNISVAAPFVWRCLTGSTLPPFHHPH